MLDQYTIIRQVNAASTPPRAQIQDAGCAIDPINCSTAVDEIDDRQQITLPARANVHSLSAYGNLTRGAALLDHLFGDTIGHEIIVPEFKCEGTSALREAA